MFLSLIHVDKASFLGIKPVWLHRALHFEGNYVLVFCEDVNGVNEAVYRFL